MPSRGAPAPAGHEIHTGALRNGFSDTSTVTGGVTGVNEPAESLAKPTASTHQVKPSETNCTRAPCVVPPDIAGRSTRNGYHAGPSPMITATSSHVAPLSAET